MTQTAVPVSPISFSNILSENKNRIADIETLKNSKVTTKGRNVIFAGTVVGGLFIAGLMASTIISGAIALAVGGITIVGLVYGIRVLKQFDPVIRQKMRNKQLEMMIEEAQENSLVQLQNQVINNGERLAHARQSRDRIGALVAKLKGRLNREDTNYEKKAEVVNTLEKSYETIQRNVDKAAEANNVFSARVMEYRDMHSFAKEAGTIMTAMNAAGSDELTKMLSLEAFDAIETDFHQALISVESSANDMEKDNNND